MPLHITINADMLAVVSAGASAIYAVVSAVSLWLLSRQIADARRFGAAPALAALLKESEEHLSSLRRQTDAGNDEAVQHAVRRMLEFYERVEHLRSAGVLPLTVLRRALGPLLNAQLADPRFAAVIQQNPAQHEEVLLLAKRLARS